MAFDEPAASGRGSAGGVRGFAAGRLFAVRKVPVLRSLMILGFRKGTYWVCDEHPRTVASLEE
jgi:hypothetical protein